MKILRLTALDRKLKRLPDAAREEMREAIGKAADEIVAMAKSLVPAGSGGRAGSKKASAHGALRDSIGWTWGRPPRGSITLGKVAASQLATDLTATIFAGNNEAFYARWAEFGTAPHTVGGKFAGAKHPGTTAQPFFYPAYRANRKTAGRLIRAGQRRAAKKVATSS